MMSSEHMDDQSQRKKKWKQNIEGSTNVNSGLFDDLQTVISSIDLVTESVSNDYSSVIEFLRKGFVTQCVQGWSYYAQVNNHAKFAEASVKLSKLVAVLNSDPSVMEHGITLIRDILSNYCKVLYRGINSMRPSITNSIFRLLQEIVSFNDGQLIDDFLTYFDLTLPSILKVLNPKKTDIADMESMKKNSHISMRSHFIGFWLALVKYSSPLLRKQILTENQKIMNSWIKHLPKIDSSSLVQESLHLLTEKVLKEASFRKATKCKILNEFLSNKLHHFYYSSNSDIVTSVDQFFQIYGSDSEFGIVFQNKFPWFDDSNVTGAYITINGREFKLHNKLLYTSLTFFKPWEDDLQCNTVVNILGAAPELVAPYCAYLASMGSHDPKMTAYWFGLTLFLGRVIQLPVPQTIASADFDGSPLTSVVIESIMPSILNKNSLSKCLQHDVPLIRQMGCQLLVFSLQKLQIVLNLYSEKEWEGEKIILLNSFFSTLPDLSIIGSVLNEAYIKFPQNKILALSLTMVIELFSSIFPNFFNLSLPSTNFYTDIMKNDSFTGIDLVILDNFLRFQGLNSTQIKWWNASNGNPSLFTSLLRVASSNNASSITSSKIPLLLHSLLNHSIIFNMDSLISSPLQALVDSLSVILKSENQHELHEIKKIWKLLDESIGRCYKAPYKYVDQANKFGRISPFLMTVVEQLSYVSIEDENSIIIKWLLIFMRNMIVLGETSLGIHELIQKLEHCTPGLSKMYFGFSDEDLLDLATSNELLSDHSESSFFSYFLLLPSNKLQYIKRFPVNSFDASAIIFRINFMISNTESFSTDKKNTVDSLLSIIGNFALSNESYVRNLVKRSYFSHLLPVSFDNLNSASFRAFFYTLNSLYQIFTQLNASFNEFRDYSYELLIELNDHNSSNDVSMARDVLIDIISPKHASLYLKQVHVLDDQNLLSLVKKIVTYKIPITGQLYLELLHRSDENVQITLLKIAKQRTIEDLDLDLLASSLVDKNIFLLEELLKIPGMVSHIPKYLTQFVGFEKELLISYYLEPTINEDFIRKTINASIKQLNDCTNWIFSRCLELFVKQYAFLTKDDIDAIMEIILKKENLKFIPQVASFLLLSARFEDPNVQLWLNKSALYITKYLAERSELHADFISFLDIFQALIKTGKIWELVKTSILNTQLEVLLSKSWVKNELLLEYTSLLILGDTQGKIQASHMLQIFLNNDDKLLGNECSSRYTTFLSSSIIYQLFFKNPSDCSNVTVQQKLLDFYQGSIDPTDTLLLSVLEHIESVTSVSWTNAVVSWELLDSLNENEADLIGPTQLISKEKEGLVVTLSKDLILKTLKNLPSRRPSRPIFSDGPVEKNWRLISDLYLSTSSHKDELISSYDPLFLLLCLVNNEQLVFEVTDINEPTHYYYDVKKMIDFGLLQFTICSLSFEEPVSMISRSILEGILISLPRCSQLKDRNLYEVLITKILYTFDKSKNSGITTQIAPLVWVAISRISDILKQPSNPQYEVASRWVLSSPFIKGREIPLLNAIMANPSMDSENYYKNLSWILQTMFEGLKNVADIKLLRSNKCLEWLLNLQNSPYVHLRLRTLIKKVLLKIQEIDGGEDQLVVGFGSIAFSECERLNLSYLSNKACDAWLKNTKNKNRELTMLSSKQELLNNKELSTRRAIAIYHDKRVREWTDRDELNIAKRICK